MKLGKRHVRRGHLAKALEHTQSLVARMLVGPPRRSAFEPASNLSGALAAPAGTTAVFEDASLRVPWSNEACARHLRVTDGRAMLFPCDRRDFGRGYDDLEALRRTLDPLGATRPRLLALDYFVAPIQLERARSSGADAVVLMARLLAPEELAPMIACARGLGLAPVVECATVDEAVAARALGVELAAFSAYDRDNLRQAELAHELADEFARFAGALELSSDGPRRPPFSAAFVCAPDRTLGPTASRGLC